MDDEPSCETSNHFLITCPTLATCKQRRHAGHIFSPPHTLHISLKKTLDSTDVTVIWGGGGCKPRGGNTACKVHQTKKKKKLRKPSMLFIALYDCCREAFEGRGIKVACLSCWHSGDRFRLLFHLREKVDIILSLYMMELGKGAVSYSTKVVSVSVFSIH